MNLFSLYLHNSWVSRSSSQSYEEQPGYSSDSSSQYANVRVLGQHDKEFCKFGVKHAAVMKEGTYVRVNIKRLGKFRAEDKLN